MPRSRPAATPVAVSVDKFAVDHDVSRAHIFGLIATGEMRSFKLGNRRLIPVSEYARVAASGSHPKSEPRLAASTGEAA